MALREVVVVLTRQAADGGLAQRFSLQTRANDRLDAILEDHKTSFTHVFDLKPDAAIRANATIDLETARREQSELSRYLRAMVEADRADALVAELRQLPGVASAYISPRVETPHAPRHAQVESHAPPGAPRDLRAMQAHVAGFSAATAWALPGGKGDGVKVVDVESGWRLSHLEFRNAGIELLCGKIFPHPNIRSHGSAVLGVIGGSAVHIDGMAPRAKLKVASHEPIGAALAIQRGAEALEAGDVLLLEMHQAGPFHGFQEREDQEGYIAIEWFPHMFEALRIAARRDVIVVEAAGNGGQNLDDAIYSKRPEWFEPDWRNPFAAGRDSGAIFVGAGAPPEGGYGVDRSRLDFSNYGARLDCQAWGEAVVTCGYGRLVAGAGEDEWYTAGFGGTSSASALIAGVLACVQGVASGRGKRLTAPRARQLLRTIGLAQQDGDGVKFPASERIGRRPDIAQLLAAI